LSNRHDFSSAEDFILAMRGTGRAKIVGDTTAGVTGGPIVRELANGWTYELSQWIEFTADKKPFEGIGLAPDIVVKSNATLMRAGTDPTLESARSLAVSSPGR
jgi:C-terminal processing protease CtpA/Prc